MVLALIKESGDSHESSVRGLDSLGLEVSVKIIGSEIFSMVGVI
jgi:hypothetical protein